MVVHIDTSVHPELVPLSWLIGTWEGVGVLGYPEHGEYHFGNRVAFHAVENSPYLRYESQAWLINADEGASEIAVDNPESIAGNVGMTVGYETGFWQVVRPRADYDAGPAFLPPLASSVSDGSMPGSPQAKLHGNLQGANPYTSAEEVEKLRSPRGGFEVEVSLSRPHGVVEIYLGRVDGARIDLATDIVARTETAKDYSAATRMYGLVEGDLLWAWDMAALGQELTSHASARLKRVE